jgi:hypothetical protein
MKMRQLQRTAIAAAVTSVLTLTVAGATAGAQAVRPATLPCRTPGTLVAASGVAVLSRATGPNVGSTIPGYWACSKGHKARVIGPGVGDTPEGGIPVAPDLEGRFVGWGDQTRTEHGCAGGVISMALDTGKKVSNPLISQCTQTIVSVRVTTVGVLAWSATLPDGTAQIVRDDRHHQRTILDAGLTVDPRSLAVNGSTAFWLRGGAAISTGL